MKLNPNCIRDVLLYLEENLTITPELELKPLILGQIEKGLPYSKEELANVLLILGEAGFIKEAHNLDGGNKIYQMSVRRITYSGYQFIETVRPKSVWEQTQYVLKQLGSFSLQLIKDISTDLLKSKFQVLLESLPT